MATAAGSSSNLLDLVHCDLCLEKYNDSDRLPKLLPCSHTFCLACVQKYYKTNLKTKLTCPNCREVFTIPRGKVQKLKTNIMAVNLLDHLTQSQVDTEEGTQETSSTLKSDKTNINEKESKSSTCGVHPGEKCDFYCDECCDPMCADCMVSLSEGPHTTHKIRKWKDVLTAYNTQRKEATDLIMDIKTHCKKRTEELLEELILFQDSLMKEAKSKCYEAHKEANRWYQNTTATISKVYNEIHAQILQFSSNVDLQELQQSLEKTDLQNTDLDFKEAQSILDGLQSSISSFTKSSFWPTKCWSVDVGKITDEFIIDLGNITKPTIKLPDVNSFPYTFEKIPGNGDVTKSIASKQSQKQQSFCLLSNYEMRPPCDWNPGLKTNKALVSFKGQSIVKKIEFRGKQIIVLNQYVLPQHLIPLNMKYFLNNNLVLLRDYMNGPSYLLNEKLELVSTIKENYGFLVGAESTHWVAFLNFDRNIINIYDLEQKQLLQKLKAPTWVNWVDECPSICRHPDSQLAAVIDPSDCILCIFNHNGHLLHTYNLDFLTNHRTSPIVCNRRHLYVVSKPQFTTFTLTSEYLPKDPTIRIFVLTWSGQLVTKLDEQQLGIPKGSYVSSIGIDEDQFTIAVCTFGGNGVRNFKTFQCV